jgi:hypothetical protein
MQVRELGHAQRFTLSCAARAIQRKSIHSFSTFTLVAALLVAGCAGGNAPPDPNANLLLVPVAPQGRVSLTPGQTGPVTFRLTTGNAPAVGRTVSFSITDPSEANGATLGNTSAVTDATGTASVEVHAALESNNGFYIRAASGTASATTQVVVAGGVGSVVVAPFFLPGSLAAMSAVKIEVDFLPDTRCEDIDPGAPPSTGLSSGLLPVDESAARFDIISTTASMNAAVGRAFDASTNPLLVAVGCVDVAGVSLLANAVVQVSLPLADVVPNPVGSYQQGNYQHSGMQPPPLQLAFPSPLAAAAAVATPWRDLSDCPLDPAQLWLDCAVDALSTSAGDPLDCVPAPGPGGEGALGDAIAALRGTPLLDGDGVPTSCRDVRSSGGGLSIDARVSSLFGSPEPPLLVALPSIADLAAHLFDQVSLSTRLAIAAGTTPQTFVVTQTLDYATFAPTSLATTSVALSTLGLPVLTSTAGATVDAGWLFIGRQAFTLHLGASARQAFNTVALVPHGVSSGAAGLVAAIATLAQTDDGTRTACDAFDATVCAAAGAPVGCMFTACGRGLGALGAKLDGSFEAANGSGLDFFLSGSAALIIGSQGTGIAGSLGADPADPSRAAAWLVDLLTSLDRASFTTAFSATRF